MMRPLAMIVGMALSALAAARGIQAESPGETLEITAFAVNMSNIATGSNAVVDLTVNTWSTAEERTHLITTVLEKGSDALLRALQKGR